MLKRGYILSILAANIGSKLDKSKGNDLGVTSDEIKSRIAEAKTDLFRCQLNQGQLQR